MSTHYIRACRLENSNIDFISTYIDQPKEKLEKLLRITNDFGDAAWIIVGLPILDRLWTFTGERHFNQTYRTIEIPHVFSFTLIEPR